LYIINQAMLIAAIDHMTSFVLFIPSEEAAILPAAAPEQYPLIPRRILQQQHSEQQQQAAGSTDSCLSDVNISHTSRWYSHHHMTKQAVAALHENVLTSYSTVHT
jgi:hypothetical protein